jgi:Tfp pilus assembly protein PilO
MIKDTETRLEIDKLKRRLDKVESVKQLPTDATLAQVIDAINRITKSTKRRG